MTKQLDRIEAMLEGLCMGMRCRVPYTNPAPKKKTLDQEREDFAQFIRGATYSYSKDVTIKVNIDAGDNGNMEATGKFPRATGATDGGGAEEEQNK